MLGLCLFRRLLKVCGSLTGGMGCDIEFRKLVWEDCRCDCRVTDAPIEVGVGDRNVVVLAEVLLVRCPVAAG